MKKAPLGSGTERKVHIMPKELKDVYKGLLAGLSEYESLQAFSLYYGATQGRLFVKSKTGEYHRIVLVPEDEADDVVRELGGQRFEEVERDRP